MFSVNTFFVRGLRVAVAMSVCAMLAIGITTAAPPGESVSAEVMVNLGMSLNTTVTDVQVAPAVARDAPGNYVVG